MNLARRYADTVAGRYALETAGQMYLRDLARGDAVPDETDADGIAWKVIGGDDGILRVGTTADGQVVCWTTEKQWAPETGVLKLWSGF